MAITFSKAISSTDLINAYNNNIVEFSSDSVLQSITCNIDIDGEVYGITPNNLNEFRFNFGGNKSAFSTLINQNDFADDKVLSIIPLDPTSLTIDDSANNYKYITVTYTITFDNETTETTTRNYHILKSIVQDEDTEVLSSTDDINWLTDGNSVTYFPGYPFDVGFFSIADDLNLTNLNGDLLNIHLFDNVNRLIIDDGYNNIEHLINLFNYDVLSFPDLLQSNLKIKKVIGCGEYIKFINKYGEWNYWLFNQRSKHIQSSKNLKQIFNDFDNIGENASPYIEIGKTSKKQIALHGTGVTEEEHKYLQYLFDSPKVYYFVGTKGSPMNSRSWLEVKLKGTKTIVKDYTGTTYNINCAIELPQRKTMQL